MQNNHRSSRRGAAVPTLLAIGALLAVALFPGSVGAQSPALQTFSSRFYTLHTNLPREEAAAWASHMDAVYAEYERRFGEFRRRNASPESLYLLATREDYLATLSPHRIDASNSAGMFVVQPSFAGLITWTHERNRSTTRQTLQHEGFHQFAFSHIGQELPIWVNEGLAQYFEDGILARGKMHLGIVNAVRHAQVLAALGEGRAIDFDRLLTMSDDTWNRELSQSPQQAGLNYAQSWSMCHFLIHAEKNKYRPRFDQYLRLVSQGHASDRAFRQAFGAPDPTAFRAKWEGYVRALKPDTLSTAVQRMEFLAQGLKYLRSEGKPTPATLEALREALQAVRFRLWVTAAGVRAELDSMDARVYRFTRSNDNDAAFELLEPSRDDQPPRILARGLNPEPTLLWLHDPQDGLTTDVEFR